MVIQLQKRLIAKAIWPIPALLSFASSDIRAQDLSPDGIMQNPGINASRSEPGLDDFRRKFPAPENLDFLMERWDKVNRSFLRLNMHGLRAKVTIIKADDSIVHGKDVYAYSAGVRQLQEYRGDSRTYTYDYVYCADRVLEMTPEMEQSEIKLPSPEYDFDWYCDESSGIDYGLYKVDPDLVLEGSVKDVACDGGVCESLNLAVAQGLDVGPGSGLLEIAVVYEISNDRPLSLRIRYNYAPGNVEYSQWDYVYDPTTEFIPFPKSRIMRPEQD